MADIRVEDNQTGLNIASPPSTSGPTAVAIFDVPLVRATEENLAGIGFPIRGPASSAALQILPWPRGPGSWRPLCEGSGTGGGEAVGVFRSTRVGGVMYSENVALGRRYVIGWLGDDPAVAAASGAAYSGTAATHVLTHEANYHADGAQIIAAQPGSTGAFVLLLAPPGDDVTPKSFRAFLVDPAHDGVTGVHISAGSWHQPAFSLEAEAVLDNRQGAVHACTAVSFVKEFGGYLRVPIDRAALQEPPPPPPVLPKAPRLGFSILLVSGGVRRALDFYARAFRLRIKFVSPGETYGELDTGATALAMCSAAHAATNFERGAGEAPAFARSQLSEPAHASITSLIVPDVDAAYAHAVACGAAPMAPPATKPWGHRVSYVRDLEGFLVELCGEMHD